MREQIIKKINSSDSYIEFTKEELEYIVKDWVGLHTKCRVKFQLMSYEIEDADEIACAGLIDRKSIVNY